MKCACIHPTIPLFPYITLVKNYRILNIALTILIAMVWFINGFFYKVLHLVPRHELIVSRILGSEHASVFALAIGIAEILIVAWILTGIKARYCAIFQMVIVAVMNIMEFILVPDLLLFGKLNIVFACLFILIIYVHEFVLKRAMLRYERAN
jgi:hypothetical protein